MSEKKRIPLISTAWKKDFSRVSLTKKLVSKRKYPGFFIITLLFLILVDAARPEEPRYSVNKGKDHPQIILDLKVPLYKIEVDSQGFHDIYIKDYKYYGAPGEYSLPKTCYFLALPPTTDLKSLNVEILAIRKQELFNQYNIRRLSPPISLTGSNSSKFSGMLSSPQLSDVPGGDFSFVKMLPPGQMRQWKIARLEYSPFAYSSRSGKLTVATEVRVRVNYNLINEVSTAYFNDDSVMDTEVRHLVDNYRTARLWYGVKDQDSTNQVKVGYAIITTEKTLSASTNLENFINHKRSKGFDVHVVTEKDFDALKGQKPNQRAEKIRKWLQDNYLTLGLKYVLLIGNPDPKHPKKSGDSEGDIPMKMCSVQVWFDISAKPTDYYYGDLTGNWDYDGDLEYGEYYDDYYRASNGVDLLPEVIVGRIPVYKNNYQDLDGILQKIIDYENQREIDWRESVLLPMAMIEPDVAGEIYDGAALGEQMKEEYLNDSYYLNHIWTQYQQNPDKCKSIYESNEPLTEVSVINEWVSNPYGVVVMSGHGGPSTIFLQCNWRSFFNSKQSQVLDDTRPAFVFLVACSSGSPEEAENLQYSILKNGGITSVASTETAYVSRKGNGKIRDDSAEFIALEYFRRIIEYNHPAGDALFSSKYFLSAGDSQLSHCYTFNLTGDPSITLKPTMPANLHAKPVNINRVDLSWVDNCADEAGFRIERHDGFRRAIIDTVPPDHTSYSDTTVNCDKTYFYRVCPFDDIGRAQGTSNAVEVYTGPIADFKPKYVPCLRGISYPIQFYDLSSNANDWYWDFGDGSYSTQQNPLHIFDTSTCDAHTYRVILKAKNGEGGQCESEKDVPFCIYLFPQDEGISVTGRVCHNQEGVSDVVINFSNFGGMAITGPDGYFYHKVFKDWKGQAIPSRKNSRFVPAKIEISPVVSPVKNLNFQCYQILEVSISASRHKEEALLIKRDYGKINLQGKSNFPDSNPLSDYRFIIYRKKSSNEYQEITMVQGIQLEDQNYIYLDKYLEKDISYVYKVSVFDSQNNLVIETDEVTIN